MRAGEYDSRSGEFIPDDDYDIDGMEPPCQPIGCDAGHHLPGCVYADVDDEDAE